MSHKILSLKVSKTFLNRILAGSKKHWGNKNEDREALSLWRKLFVNDVFVHMNYLILHSWTLVVCSGSHIQIMQTPQAISRIFPWVFRRKGENKIASTDTGTFVDLMGLICKTQSVGIFSEQPNFCCFYYIIIFYLINLLLIFVLVLRYMPSTNVLHTRASRKTRKKNVEEAAGRCLDRARCIEP